MGKKVEQSLIEITNSASNEVCFSSTLISHYEHCVTTVPLLALRDYRPSNDHWT